MSYVQLTEKQCNDTQCKPPDDCRERYWYIFLSSSLIAFFGGIVVILVFRLVVSISCKRRVQDASPPTPSFNGPVFNGKSPDIEVPWMTAVKDWAGALISAQTKTGKFLMAIKSAGKINGNSVWNSFLAMHWEFRLLAEK